eukprot:TRINITY_DN8190_c1_g1_i1.p1 TRINITY_DN8190_c1_g1~~TRINITY_DN8190_c1_g1_i1.p1  ORF type:complete len:968 (-),score=223.23 TRINITY_DN8190_c1_g1_i1:41-2944(-)
MGKKRKSLKESSKEEEEKNKIRDGVFVSFGSVGRFTTSTPFNLRYMADGNVWITLCLGNRFQVRELENRLNVQKTSQMISDKIKYIETLGPFTFAACGNFIYGFNRHVLKARSQGENHRNEITQLLSFGSEIISISKEENTAKIRDCETLGFSREIQFSEGFFPTVAVHPPTYVNKILFGSTWGTLELWNTKTMKRIYRFKNVLSEKGERYGDKSSLHHLNLKELAGATEEEKDIGQKNAITSIACSPVLDVVAIGFEDGTIVIHNLRTDENVVRFWQVEGRVTTLSFRTEEQPILVSGTVVGSIILWDLEKQKLFKIVADAHHSLISKLEFIQGQPLLISSGSDNCIKQWIFDKPDGSCRVLRERGGHFEPITAINWYDGEYNGVFTGSMDRSIRVTSENAADFGFKIAHDKKSKAGQKILEDRAKINRMPEIPPVTSIRFSSRVEKDWPGAVTLHQDSSEALTWDMNNRRCGKNWIRANGKLNQQCAIEVSRCGNFMVTGDLHGQVKRYNLQSGQIRGEYLIGTMKAHEGKVTGICTDLVNKHVITSGLDGRIRIWNFNECKLESTIEVGQPIYHLIFHRENELAAIVCEDFSIRVYDIDSRKMVRHFEGHNEKITDLAFSPDCRMIVSAGDDMTVRVWDLPSGKMVDWFKTDELVIGLAFSPSGHRIATAHSGRCEIYLWTNLLHYADIILRPIDPKTSSPPRAELPSTLIESRDIKIEEDYGIENHILPKIEDNDEDEIEKHLKKKQEEADLAARAEREEESKRDFLEGLITLSSGPISKMQSIVHHDVIKERNRVQLPEEKPKLAPFVLPVISGLVPTFAPLEEEEPVTKLQKRGEYNTTFANILESCVESGDYAETINMMKKFSPSQADYEFLNLSYMDDGLQIRGMLELFKFQLEKNSDFELVQAFLHVFLKHHSEFIASNQEIQNLAQQLLECQRKHWSRLQSLMDQNLCLVKFFSGIQ